jgi:hypothetical protein
LRAVPQSNRSRMAAVRVHRGMLYRLRTVQVAGGKGNRARSTGSHGRLGRPMDR